MIPNHPSLLHPPSSTYQPAAWSWVIFLAIVAIIPRIVGLDDFLTYDEAYHWIGRTERFFDGVRAHDWAATRQTGHPGVTTMWLGSIGLALKQLAAAIGWPIEWAHRDAPPIVAHLAWMRLPSAVAHGAVVGIGYRLLSRLVSPPTAVLAAVMWATSPFLIAHSRLLHTDALLADFVLLSLLCILLACLLPTDHSSLPSRRRPYRLGWLIASGVWGGLALLTKGPALILLPSIGLILFWRLPAAEGGFSLRTLWQRISRSLAAYAVWMGVALLVVWVCWPALWVTPTIALERYIAKILWEGGNPFTKAQFFFGEAVTDPGLFFYLVSDLFRMTPVAMIGLFALPLAWLRYRRLSSGSSGYSSPLVLYPQQRTVVHTLGAFVIFWTAVMLVGSKKFDRYVLPTWAPFLVVSAAGWNAMVWWVGQYMRAGVRKAAVASMAVGIGAVLIVTIWHYHPYYLSYYNPLLGGGTIAHRVLLVGWGEGMDQVGAYLRSRNDLDYAPVYSTETRLLEPFVEVPVKHISEMGEGVANYVVVGLPSLQRDVFPHITTELQSSPIPPLHRVMIHGIPYATIYQRPRPFEEEIGVAFGTEEKPLLHLYGVTVEEEWTGEKMTEEKGMLTRIVVTPSWGCYAPTDVPYWVFVHVLNAEGDVVAQVDVPPGGASHPPTTEWEAGQHSSVPLPLPLPPDLPAGEYEVVMGVYQQPDGARILPLGNNPALQANTVVVTRFTVR